MFTRRKPTGGYCPKCEEFGPSDEPCWGCGGKMQTGRSSMIASGHRYNPQAESAVLVGETVVLDEREEPLWD